MYKLWHWLFGWDYVRWTAVEDSAFGLFWSFSSIKRVYIDRDSLPFLLFGNKKSIINTPTFDDRYFENIEWLTCSPDKYFPKDK